MTSVIGRGFDRAVGGRLSDRSCYQSPFVVYYTVTFTLNGVAIIGGILSQFDLHRNNYGGYWNRFDRCDGWLFANACFGCIHILAALYLVKKIRQPELNVATGGATVLPTSQTTKTKYKNVSPYAIAEPILANPHLYDNSAHSHSIATGGAINTVVRPDSTRPGTTSCVGQWARVFMPIKNCFLRCRSLSLFVSVALSPTCPLITLHSTALSWPTRLLGSRQARFKRKFCHGYLHVDFLYLLVLALFSRRFPLQFRNGLCHAMCRYLHCCCALCFSLFHRNHDVPTGTFVKEQIPI